MLSQFQNGAHHAKQSTQEPKNPSQSAPSYTAQSTQKSLSPTNAYLIGIVVPIYNVAPFLSTCLESIIAQTHSHFICVLVDDGSTDSECKELAKAYVAKDSRFVLICKANGGLSSARNAGIYFFQAAFELAPSHFKSAAFTFSPRIKERIEKGEKAFKEINSSVTRRTEGAVSEGESEHKSCLKEINSSVARRSEDAVCAPTNAKTAAQSLENGSNLNAPDLNLNENAKTAARLSPKIKEFAPNLLFYAYTKQNALEVEEFYFNPEFKPLKDFLQKSEEKGLNNANSKHINLKDINSKETNSNSTHSKELNLKELNFKVPEIDAIIFIDSDDLWHTDTLELCVAKMYGIQENKSGENLDCHDFATQNLAMTKEKANSINSQNPTMTGGKCETAPRSYEEQKSTSEQASHTSIPHKNPPQADIVYFDSHVFYDECEPIEHTTFMEHAKMTKEGLITPKEWLKYVKNSRLGFFWFSKEGLINFKFLQKIGLLFMPSIIHEDHHFGVLLFARAKNIYVLPQKLYEYRIRANSIMNHSGTSLELGTPARYLQGIYDAFERLDDAKAYHKAASWVLTNLAFIELIKDKNLPRAVRKGVKAHLLPRHCEWALAVLKAPYDPWGVKTKANIKLMKKYKDNLLMTIIKRAL